MLNLHRPTCIVRTDSVKSPESDEQRAELSDWTAPQTLCSGISFKRNQPLSVSISPWRKKKKGNRFVWILNKRPCGQPGSSQTSDPTDYCKGHVHILNAVSVLLKHTICQLIWSGVWRSPRSLQVALSDKPHCSLTLASPWTDCLHLFALCIYIILLFIIWHFLYCAITSRGEWRVILRVSVERPLLLLNNVT